MDEQLKHQITGAVIWFVFTAWIVGDWYTHPVNFSPEGEAVQKAASAEQIVKKPLKLDLPLKQLPERSVPTEAHIPPLQPQTESNPPQVSVETSNEKVQFQPQSQPEKASIASTQRQMQGYLIKVAAYYSEAPANALSADLNALGYDAWYKTFTDTKGARVYSVRVGPVSTKEEALQIKKELDRRFYTRCKIEHLRQTEKK